MAAIDDILNTPLEDLIISQVFPAERYVGDPSWPFPCRSTLPASVKFETDEEQDEIDKQLANLQAKDRMLGVGSGS